jgi:hypothetical protein
MNHPFTSNLTVMIVSMPWKFNREVMTHDAMPDEAVEKLHRFCHLRKHIPISWLVCASSARRYQTDFKEWKHHYGDEIGIYEPAIYGKRLTPPGVQSWVEECGLTRPDVCLYPGSDDWWPYNSLLWRQLDEKDQLTGLRYLKKIFDAYFEQDTKLVYGACGDASTLRAARQAGFKIFWGFIWHLYGDMIDSTGRGCLPYPFYPSDVHVKAPADRGENPVLGMPWGIGEYGNTFVGCRQNHNALCWAGGNAADMANRAGTLRVMTYFENLWRQFAEMRQWNPFVHAPFQIEANLIDESGNFFVNCPHFPRRSSEMLFHQIETAQKYGAEFVTHEHFYDWYIQNYETTPEMLYYMEDSIPDSQIPGKDHIIGPILIAGSRSSQKIFLRDSGFNSVRTYRYDNPKTPDDPNDEYPYELEPDVDLRTQAWTGPSFGVQISSETGIRYSSDSWMLTARKDEPDYTTVLWSVNIPEYVAPEDLQCSENIRRVRLIRQKNLAVVDAVLIKGHNTLSISSDLPAKYITMEPAEYHHHRIEFWLENCGSEVAVNRFHVKLKPGLSIGGFWWDGEYFETMSQLYNSSYNMVTGDLCLNGCYPNCYRLRHGVSRVSIELPNEVK